MVRIAIISDTDISQINGVVTTYKNTINELRYSGFSVHMFDSVYGGKRFALPGYEEVQIALQPWKIKHVLDYQIHNGAYIHIATEGPVGLFAILYLSWKKYPFTTCYHSKFPEFIEARTKISAKWFYPYFRWFHNRSKCVMVPTEGMKELLESKGFKNVKVWTRGVDTSLFNPTPYYSNYILCVSRVSHEKNLDVFCQLPHRRKVLVGDGPYLAELKAKYPDVHYAGKQTGKDLADWYRNALCFVFPSVEDTFGIVMLEAIASGVPVAAFPGPGQSEVINEKNGIISDNLSEAVNKCLLLNRDDVHKSSEEWLWKTATKNFINNIIS